MDMKKIKRFRLSQLNKDSMEERRIAKIMGGYHCAFGPENQSANEAEGKCSCACPSASWDYYDSTDGLNGKAQEWKIR